MALAVALFGHALATGATVLPTDLLRIRYPWGAYLAERPPHEPLASDPVLQFFPWFREWAEAVRAGSFPLWNPRSGLGMPFAANPQTASFFPLTALSLLGPAAGWNLLLAVRLALAVVTAGLWLREAGRSRGAAVAGGIAFALSFPFFSWLQWPHANVHALLPLLLLLARRLALRPTARAAAAFGGTLALMHLGGHPESVFLDAAAALVLFLTSRPRPRGALLFAGAGCLGTLAASIQIVPFLEYLRRSRVWLEPGHETLVLPKRLAATWIVPLLWGWPRGAKPWGWDRSFLDWGATAGAVFLVLAGIALALRPRARRAAPLLLLGAIPAGLAYGVPPFSWLPSLPFLGRVMTHRSLPVAALAIVTLGALGWDRLRAARRARRGAATVLVPAALALAALLLALAVRSEAPAGEASAARRDAARVAAMALAVWGAAVLVPARRRAAAGAALGFLVLADSGRLAWRFHPETAGEVFFPTRFTRALAREGPGYRVLPLGDVMPPNLNLPYGVASALAYDAIDPLDQVRFLRSLEGYLGKGLYSMVAPPFLRNPGAARLAGVRFLLDDPLAPPLDTEEYARASGYRLQRVYDAPDGRIYRLDGALPLVSFAARALPDPGLRRFHSMLAAGDERVARALFADVPDLSAQEGPGSVAYARPSAERIEARVSSASGGWVVFAEALDTGWEATLDGSRVPILTANDVLRTVHVPPGAHIVEVRYRPPSLRRGLLLSAAGLAGLALLARSSSRSPVSA